MVHFPSCMDHIIGQMASAMAATTGAPTKKLKCVLQCATLLISLAEAATYNSTFSWYRRYL